MTRVTHELLLAGAACLALAAPVRTASAEPTAAPRDACSLLSKEDAAQALGVVIERVESKTDAGTSTCNYYVKPASSQARQQDVAKRFLDIAKGKPGPEPEVRDGDASTVARQTGLGDLVKSLGTAAASPTDPYLAITVVWTGGKSQLATLKGVIAANSPGVRTTEALRGIGDDAVLGPVDSVLMFVKGDTAVSIGLARVPEARDKGIAMARTIAGRL